MYGAFHLEAPYFVQQVPNCQIDPWKKILLLAEKIKILMWIILIPVTYKHIIECQPDFC